MFFDKIVKIEKNYVERVENINIKVYTTNCVDMCRQYANRPFERVVFESFFFMKF